jgi:hypothetical protein
MALTEAQADLRRAHVNGGAGVIVSGLAWLAASIVFVAAGPRPAFFTLFLCGLAIAPVAQLVTRFVFKAPPSGAGKRLEWIAIATVPVLLAGFYIGWLKLDTAPLAAVPIVAIGVGLRYVAFPVMYGGLIFAGLGAAFIAGGAAGLVEPESAIPYAALVLAVLELATGTVLARKWVSTRAAL